MGFENQQKTRTYNDEVEMFIRPIVRCGSPDDTDLSGGSVDEKVEPSPKVDSRHGKHHVAVFCRGASTCIHFGIRCWSTCQIFDAHSDTGKVVSCNSHGYPSASETIVVRSPDLCHSPIVI